MLITMRLIFTRWRYHWLEQINRFGGASGRRELINFCGGVRRQII